MPRKIQKDEIEQKLEYLGLDIVNAEEQLSKKYEPLEFRVPKAYDEKQYRQYRYIPIKDIQILLSPTNRLDDLQEKYKKSSPLISYLDSKNEENFIKHATFLNMLKQVKIEEIEKVEKEQEQLNKKIPFKVKFEGNYLWQIYYDSNSDQYFMLVPTEDADYSTFFFLLKKQLEKKKTGKIFVPIRNVQYSNTYLKKSEFEDLENYLWLFTKDWPLIYEVYDKSDKLSIQIIGETEVYGKIKSLYKVKLNDLVEANQFYKLLKAMFIIQTELPHYFKFETNINKSGEIEFYFDKQKMEYADIVDWIQEQFKKVKKIKNIAQIFINENSEKLEKLKIEAAEQEIEYLAKEKQISTFLECRKSFFGKFKYYFKYSKKNVKNKIKRNVEEVQTQEVIEKDNQDNENEENKTYTLEQLIEQYKSYEIQENEIKNLVMDINALKLKNKNMKKKIENATSFIEEIDSHKRSIFEFWKYSNKDEVASLTEGEQEEVNIIKKIARVFDYNDDLENFGKQMDKIQRNVLSKDEMDSIYLTTTNVLDVLNKVKNNTVTPKEIETSLKMLKNEAKKEKSLIEEEIDIFGGIAQDSTKISKISNKKHRELPKDKFSILDINKNSKQIGYKLALEQVTQNIKSGLSKVVLQEDLPIYKSLSEGTLDANNINVFDINPEHEIKEIMNQDTNKINFYKINLKRGINAISYTNSIFYDNQNKTLPIGQDISTKILVDVSKLDLTLIEKRNIKIANFEDEKNDFSKIDIKTVIVWEYDINIQKQEKEE